MDTAKIIANSLVTSRLDYCNSLLFNVDDKYMKQLQRVQNSLARVVCKTSKFRHINLFSIRCIGPESSTELISKLTLWFIKHSILISLSTFGNYCHYQKTKEPVPQELESLLDIALLKPRLVLVLSMLLLHTSGIPFL